MRNGRDAGLLQRLGRDEELVPRRGHLRAGLAERLGIRPKPIDAVDVDRHCDVVALVLQAVGDDLGNQRVPLPGLGHRVHVLQDAFLRPFDDRRPLDLRR